MTLCGNNSPIVQSAAFLTLLAYILHLLGFAIPYWSSRAGSNEGLWQVCNGITCETIIGTALGGQAWFIAVQVLDTVGLFLGLTALIITFLVMFDSYCFNSTRMRLSGLIFEFTTAVVLLAAVLVYINKGFIYFTDFNLHFSWGATLAAVIIYAIAGIILATELKPKKKDDKDPTPDTDTDTTKPDVEPEPEVSSKTEN